MLDWLNDIMNRILSVLPRIVILAPNEAAVRTTAVPFIRTWTSSLGQGWYLNWELFQELTAIEITSQVTDLRPQSVHTKDNFTVVVSGAVQYRIMNAYKAILDVQDIDVSLAALALGTIAKHVSKHSFEELRDSEELEQLLRSELAKWSSGWGLKIEKVFITDFGKVKNIRLLGNAAIND